MLVASPLYVRQAIAAFEAIDTDLVAASRTLGAGPVRTFFVWRCRWRVVASQRARRSASRAESASSAPRSCSPAASRDGRRR
jgi:ABC-type tungstate transport system substrate-binding protein